jgi:hypothetical protein
LVDGKAFYVQTGFNLRTFVIHQQPFMTVDDVEFLLGAPILKYYLYSKIPFGNLHNPVADPPNVDMNLSFVSQ